MYCASAPSLQLAVSCWSPPHGSFFVSDVRLRKSRTLLWYDDPEPSLQGEDVGGDLHTAVLCRIGVYQVGEGVPELLIESSFTHL